MICDVVLYLEDENGDVLWNMLQDGDDLIIFCEVDFVLIFLIEDVVIVFVVYLLCNEQKVLFFVYEENEDFLWQVVVYLLMILIYQNIVGFEGLLVSEVVFYSGKVDGWGCMLQVS